MHTTQLLHHLQQETRQWEALLEQIGWAHMDQPGVNGDWSMKDMVAHHTVWNLRTVADMQAALRGQPYPPPLWPAYLEGEDQINGWIYNMNRMRPAPEVLNQCHAMLQDLLAVIAALPDNAPVQEIDGKFYKVWIHGHEFLASEFFNHFHDEHEADVRAWLESKNGSAAT